jgi:hypothetical protein
MSEGNLVITVVVILTTVTVSLIIPTLIRQSHIQLFMNYYGTLTTYQQGSNPTAFLTV